MLKIYLTDLAAYNSGALVGKWINLPIEEDELQLELKNILALGEQAVDGTNHEEWFITDYEWENISFLKIDEYENIYKLNENLQLLEVLNQYQLKAVKFILDEQYTNDIEDAILKAEDVTIYEDQTIEDVAYDLMQECYEIPKLPSIISNNIDYTSIAHELEMDGTHHVVGNDVLMYLG